MAKEINERYIEVKAAAAMRGMTIKELAGRLGFDPGSVYNALRADKESPWMRIAINKELGIEEVSK